MTSCDCSIKCSTHSGDTRDMPRGSRKILRLICMSMSSVIWGGTALGVRTVPPSQPTIYFSRITPLTSYQRSEPTISTPAASNEVNDARQELANVIRNLRQQFLASPDYIAA